MRLRNFLPLALLIIGSFWSAPLLAQDAAAAATSSPGLMENPGMETNYILLTMAVLQVVIILTLSGIMKTLGGTGTVWADFLKGRRAAGVLAVLLAGSTLDAQAATPAVAMVTTQTLLYWLISANIILFVIIVAQLSVIRGMVRVLGGPESETRSAKETSFADTVLNRLTRTVKVEKEEDILLHHEYDGIRELDNVLPPWWVWLFYGTVIWSVVYIVNVHVIDIWPDQKTEYATEMAQADAEIAARYALRASSLKQQKIAVISGCVARAPATVATAIRVA